MEKLSKAVLVRETEKAILVKVWIGDVAKKDVWLPKSQTKVEGDSIFASSWILDQKDREFCTAEFEYQHIETERLAA